MPVNCLRFNSLGLLLSLAITGCQSTLTPVVDDNPKPSTKVIAEQHQLILHHAQQTHTLYQANTDIEALGGTEQWLLWSEDDNPALQLAPLTKTSQALQASALTELPHDADLICAAPLTDEVLDVFIHDGDQYFYHYWLSAQQNTLQPVRRIATNPEIAACTVTASELIFADPFIGALVLDRDPETDSILHRASSAQARSLQDLNAGTLALNAVPSRASTDYPGVVAVMETEPVADRGDAADDPAILTTASHTWIAGTNKQRGLAMYDLSGKQQHFIARGRLNNVDAIAINDQQFLLAASNRTHKTIDLFIANPADDTLRFSASIDLQLDDPYGLCMAKYNDGVAVFVGDSEGMVEYWQLNSDLSDGERLQQFTFPSQTEGCVFDRVSQQLYIGEENVGIWRIDLSSGERTLVESNRENGLVADVEGLDIYYGQSHRYLIASSQGDNSYAIFQLEPWAMLGKFRITADVNTGIDGASETDGLAVTAMPSPGLPSGMLVVQDGRNRAPDQAQNFKVVDWRHIEALIEQWQPTH